MQHFQVNVNTPVVRTKAGMVNRNSINKVQRIAYAALMEEFGEDAPRAARTIEYFWDTRVEGGRRIRVQGTQAVAITLP